MAELVVDTLLKPHEKVLQLKRYGLKQVELCLNSGLKRQFSDSNWRLFDRYVIMAGHFPSKSYVPTLVSALDMARLQDEIYALDIVLTLSDLADPDSVPVLARTVSWRRENDEGHDLALNAIDALLHIDSRESRDFVASLVGDDRGEVQELAQEIAANPDRYW